MCILLTKQKYNEILQFCLDLMSGAHPWSLYIAGSKQAYRWAAKYDAVVVGDGSAVLVLGPTKCQNVDALSTCLSAFQSTCLSALQQPTYVERLFSDLHKLHCVDHCKGNIFISMSSKLTRMYPVSSARCSLIAALSALGKITEREAARITVTEY
jgi:hypothetical protein